MKVKDLNVFQAGTKYLDLTYPPASGSGESWNYSTCYQTHHMTTLLKVLRKKIINILKVIIKTNQ